ncbi:MAG: NAD(P)H-dependent glycerol-3-phosphate dehydrogenase [Rikenellaceae bacterium]
MEAKQTIYNSCAVIGYGSWATAIVKILCEQGSKVGWHIRNEEVIEGIISEGSNPKYLRDVEFDVSQLTISSDINEIVENHDIIIMATPSAFLAKILSPLTVSLEGKLVVSAIKGIIAGEDEYLTVIEFLSKKYNVPFSQQGIITGPSHAEEVALERLSYLTVVCPNIDLAHIIGSKIECKYIKVQYSTDLYGVEYATVLKNIYAIAVGIAVGLGYGDNFIAVLIANSAREMNNFLHGSYPDERDTRESAYLGDLLVTCYSSYSRNRRLGLLMGKGFTIKSALNEMTMVSEGYFAADCIRHVNIKNQVDMPIATMVYDILYTGAKARKAMKNLTKELI